MKTPSRRIGYLLLALLVPFLSFLSPSWIAISNVGPNWSVFWLLPWALQEGAFAGTFAGLCLGMLLDAIHINGATQIPSLMLLGFWWGLLGRKAPTITNSFSLGLLAWLGTCVIGLTIWLQKIFFISESKTFFFHNGFFYALFAQAIVTALLAPMICSWMFLYFFRQRNR
ncbi:MULTISPECIES: hypothetical protein [Prochlorococcus]|uniref:hypothetical protein n=1 Tax=Prochlorococcus TaxID=1218 RepID=UPI000561C4FC|nr:MULTISPECIES: hypothetical protein [Prochlorococcus]